MKTVMSQGTSADKIAAHTVQVQDSPVHSLIILRNLIGMVRVGKKNECISAMGKEHYSQHNKLWHSTVLLHRIFLPNVPVKFLIKKNIYMLFNLNTTTTSLQLHLIKT
jgi:hypothetical protein